MKFGDLFCNLFLIMFQLFMILWPLFVYYPLAHWIRAADGWLSNTVDVIDVAGGLTLHTTAGLSV